MTSRVTPSPAEARLRRRAKRTAREAAHAGLVRTLGYGHRAAQCGEWLAAGPRDTDTSEPAEPWHVELHRHLETSEVFIGNTITCAMAWLCPICAVPTFTHLGQCIATAVARSRAAGEDQGFLTVTVPHGLEDELADVLGLVDQLRYLLVRGRLYRHLRDRWGLVSWCDVGEHPRSWASGWHPHAHLVLFFDHPLADHEWDDLEAWLGGEMADHVNAWLPAPTAAKPVRSPLVPTLDPVAERARRRRVARHATTDPAPDDMPRWRLVDDARPPGSPGRRWHRRADPARVAALQPVRCGADGTSDVAGYLTKIGFEVTAGAGKDSRSGESLDIFGMLARLDELGRVGSLGPDDHDERTVLAASVKEYASVMAGRHVLRCARNWWDRYLPDVRTRSVQATCKNGRQLEVIDRARLVAAVEALAAVLGGAPPVALDAATLLSDDPDAPAEPDDVDTADTSAVDAPPDADTGPEVAVVVSELVATIEGSIWLDLLRLLRDGAVPGVLLEVVQASRLPPRAAVVELVERHGPVRALLWLAALFRAPPPVWIDADGVHHLSDEPRPGWQPVTAPPARAA